MDDFVIARNPDEQSSLPFVVRLPLGPDGVVLKVRDTWPRTAKIYCHADRWPDDPHIVERVPVRSCVRRGAAIDLVLDRGREQRSQFVFTRARGREMIFWQSARTTRQARPNVSLPTQRASGHGLEILVDSHERYPWRFHRQQASTRRRLLTAGDYGVEVDGRLVAAVERKSLADLVGTLTGGKLRYLLAALAHHRTDAQGELLTSELLPAGPLPAAEPTAAEIRAWAADAGLEVSAKGRIAADIRSAYDAAHPGG